MGGSGRLTVGPIILSYSGEETDSELLAVFRDDMLRNQGEPVEQSELSSAAKECRDVVELWSPGSRIADRLDVMGINETSILGDLEELFRVEATRLLDPTWLADQDDFNREWHVAEGQLLQEMTGLDWVERFAAGWRQPDPYSSMSPGSFVWLRNLIDEWTRVAVCVLFS